MRSLQRHFLFPNLPSLVWYPWCCTGKLAHEADVAHSSLPPDTYTSDKRTFNTPNESPANESPISDATTDMIPVSAVLYGSRITVNQIFALSMLFRRPIWGHSRGS
jgi:hypothetical protein